MSRVLKNGSRGFDLKSRAKSKMNGNIKISK